MFSIYSHVRNRDQRQAPDDYDSDAQTPTPPPSLPAPRQSQPAVIPRPGQASSLPTPSRPTSHVDPARNSAPAFTRHQPSKTQIAPATVLYPSKASEPSTSDEEEATEAPAVEEFLAGDPPDQSGRWARDVVKREAEASPIQRSDHPRITPPPLFSKKTQLLNQHRGFLLGIKRSLRGRVLSNAPVGDRSVRNTRYISPFTPDELQDFYNKRRRSAERVEAWVEEVSLEIAPIPVEIGGRVESTTEPPLAKPRESITPELKKQRRQRRKSNPVSSRQPSVRNARVEKPERTGVAARRSKATKTPSSPLPPPPPPPALNRLATMLTDPNPPDAEIAPLVTTWTQTLLSKIDTLNTSLAERAILISALETESATLSSHLAEANSKAKTLQAKLARLEAAAPPTPHQAIPSLKTQIETLDREKRTDQMKIQNLNSQLSTLVRQARVDRKAFEKKEMALKQQMEEQQQQQQQRASKEKKADEEMEESYGSRESERALPASRSIRDGGGSGGLEEKYDALEKIAREVARECGIMAGDNFGACGLALAKLKRHMGE